MVDEQVDAPDDERVERAVRFVAASPQAIFDLLADPRQHVHLDGSGSVRGVAEAPERLELGSTFQMSMRLGVPYRITSTVVEFDEPAQIGWRHVGGHIWRYRLRAVEGGTEVTEEFDWRPSRAPLMLRLIQAPRRNASALEATLDQLAAYFADNGDKADTD
ncbi:MAG: SRPBCC family protein [Actinomycetota bacterium]